MIPKIVHQIWFGKPMPRVYRTYLTKLRRLHPGWQFHLWTEQTLEPKDLLNRKLFEDLLAAAAPVAQIADLLRYDIVARKGGFYIDSDFEFFKPLDPLLERNTDLLVSYEIDHQGQTIFTNSFFAALPDHPFLHQCIKQAAASIEKHGIGGDLTHTLGPRYFNQLLRAQKDVNPDAIISNELLYPYNYWEPERRYESFPHAIAAHRWGGSWAERKHPVLGRLNDIRKTIQWYVRGKLLNFWRCCFRLV